MRTQFAAVSILAAALLLTTPAEAIKFPDTCGSAFAQIASDGLLTDYTDIDYDLVLAQSSGVKGKAKRDKIAAEKAEAAKSPEEKAADEAARKKAEKAAKAARDKEIQGKVEGMVEHKGMKLDDDAYRQMAMDALNLSASREFVPSFLDAEILFNLANKIEYTPGDDVRNRLN